MPWSDPMTWTERVLTDTDLNREIRDNMRETAPAKTEALGDLTVGIGPHSIVRLAKGEEGQVLVVQGGRVVWRNVLQPGWVKTSHQVTQSLVQTISFAGLDTNVGGWRMTGDLLISGGNSVCGIRVNLDSGSYNWTPVGGASTSASYFPLWNQIAIGNGSRIIFDFILTKGPTSGLYVVERDYAPFSALGLGGYLPTQSNVNRFDITNFSSFNFGVGSHILLEQMT